MLLSHALGDPDDVAVLLLFELEERIEDAVAELAHERVQVHLDLLLEETVFDCLVAWVRADVVE